MTETSPPSPKIILFNKPFQVLCQFSAHENKTTLAQFIDLPNVYPAGRLDFDSEGLLLLTDNGDLQTLITHPKHKLSKTYWAQVEGIISEHALELLAKGVQLKDGVTKPAAAKRIDDPGCWERHPAIRERANIATSWVELTIHEGKNRQVRRMTAAVGFPTLRLIRKSIGKWDISNLAVGAWCETTLPTDLEKQLIQRIGQKKQPYKHKRTNKHANKATNSYAKGRR